MSLSGINSITNAIHFLALISYTILGLHYCQQQNSRWRLSIVFFFGILAIGKLAGVIAHLPPENWPSYLPEMLSGQYRLIWNFIAIQIFFGIGVTLFLMPVPRLIGRLCIIASLLLSVCSILKQSFLFLSLSQILTVLICIHSTHDYLRLSWCGVLVSNIIWIVIKYGLLFFLLHISIDTIKHDYAFYNDIYHIMLIISTFYLFKSVEQGLWPEEGSL